MPLKCGSWTLTASDRRRSMIIRSSANMSGRWSYFDEMYWVIASESETVWERRNGSWRILLYRLNRRICQWHSSLLTAARMLIGVLTTPLSLEAGVWKTPFVLTAGGSTPPGNEMTLDRLRHQLIISNTWLRTLFIRHYPSHLALAKSYEH